MSRAASRGKDLAGFIVAALIAAGCVRLGFWQISRLHERRALNARIDDRGRLPVLALTGAESLDSVQWRRVRAVGVYDFTRERVWTGRTLEGVPGVALLAPLRLANGGIVWVNRGWVPSPDAWQVDASRWREPDSAEVVGVAVPHAGIAFLVEDSLPARAMGGPGTPVIRRWPAPELSEGPHLSYAIQWFSFAVIILGGSLIFFSKRWSRAGSHGGTTI
jgi:surfeit locus 1 family protein